MATTFFVRMSQTVRDNRPIVSTIPCADLATAELLCKLLRKDYGGTFHGRICLNVRLSYGYGLQKPVSVYVELGNAQTFARDLEDSAASLRNAVADMTGKEATRATDSVRVTDC